MDRAQAETILEVTAHLLRNIIVVTLFRENDLGMVQANDAFVLPGITLLVFFRQKSPGLSWFGFAVNQDASQSPQGSDMASIVTIFCLIGSTYRVTPF